MTAINEWKPRNRTVARKPGAGTRRAQLLSGKVRETQAEKKARIKAENLAARDQQRQKTREKFAAFYALIETEEFQEWHEYNGLSRWKFDTEKDDPAAAIRQLWVMVEHLKHVEAHERTQEVHFVEVKEPTGRQTRMQHAQPAWADKTLIKQIYAHRDRLNAKFRHLGPFHVDHVVPIMGKLVCGLHVEFNMRVIPQKENLEKSNKFIEKVLHSCIVQFQYGE